MASQTVNPATLDFILQTTKDDPEVLLHDVDAMDQKTVQVFASASVIVGLASLAQATGGDAPTILFGLALGAYFVAMLASLWSLFVRKYARGLYADTLWNDYWDKDVDFIRLALVEATTNAFNENVKILTRKSYGLRIALLATGIEASLVGLGIVLARIG